MPCPSQPPKIWKESLHFFQGLLWLSGVKFVTWKPQSLEALLDSYCFVKKSKKNKTKMLPPSQNIILFLHVVSDPVLTRGQLLNSQLSVAISPFPRVLDARLQLSVADRNTEVKGKYLPLTQSPVINGCMRSCNPHHCCHPHSLSSVSPFSLSPSVSTMLGAGLAHRITVRT